MLEDAGIEFGPCRLEAYVHSPAHETNSLQQRLISAVAVAHSLKKTLSFLVKTPSMVFVQGLNLLSV